MWIKGHNYLPTIIKLIRSNNNIITNKLKFRFRFTGFCSKPSRVKFTTRILFSNVCVFDEFRRIMSSVGA